VIRHEVLYGGSDLLGACGAPDYLVSHRFDETIVVSITMFLIGYCHVGPEIPGWRKTREWSLVSENSSDGGFDE